MRKSNNFKPTFDKLEEVISQSAIVAVSIPVLTAFDTLAPGGGHSAPIILEPITAPPTTIVA